MYANVYSFLFCAHKVWIFTWRRCCKQRALEAKKRFPVALPIGKKYFHVRKLVFFVQRMRIVGVSLKKCLRIILPRFNGNKAANSEIVCSERRRFVLRQDTLLGALTLRLRHKHQKNHLQHSLFTQKMAKNQANEFQTQNRP
jgi:hypothetical protein